MKSLPKGFRGAAIAAGLKSTGALDLTIIENLGPNCKTNKEEYYDLMVCIVIISLANNIETFAFSTDGNISDWLPAFKIYEHYIGPINIRFNRFIVDTSQFFDPYKD